jgi:hypothetical protein
VADRSAAGGRRDTPRVPGGPRAIVEVSSSPAVHAIMGRRFILP